jgi:hypothetical protein
MRDRIKSFGNVEKKHRVFPIFVISRVEFLIEEIKVFLHRTTRPKAALVSAKEA